MEFLRVKDADLSVYVSVNDPNTDYEYTVRDLSDMSEFVGVSVSDSDGQLKITFSDRYDSSYLLKVNGTEMQVDIVRPYSEVLGGTATEQEEYKKHERMARAVIDSIIPEGFYFRKRLIETTGIGSDYLPIWSNAKKLLYLYENNVLMFDWEDPNGSPYKYGITDDKTAIVQLYNERVNRLEGAALVMPSAGSDLLDVKYTYRGFPKTFDYKIVLEDGYYELPEDIKLAASLLVEDISCGKLEYFKRYISAYKTDQFNLTFSGEAFEGTGNLVVDKILSKYAKSIRTIGVL
jgi:hypothetical protein